MNILTYIENIYQKWDGTDEQAAICLRQIHLALFLSKVDTDDDD